MLNAETMSQEDEINEKINFAFERVESTEARNQKFLDTANELCTMIFKGNPKAQKTQRSRSSAVRAPKKGFGVSSRRREHQL